MTSEKVIIRLRCDCYMTNSSVPAILENRTKQKKSHNKTEKRKLPSIPACVNKSCI
jgi:hypothetical protein